MDNPFKYINKPYKPVPGELKERVMNDIAVAKLLMELARLFSYDFATNNIPGTMPYEYFSDENHLKEWLTAEKDPETFKAFLKRNIYDCKTNYDYIRANGGARIMKALRAKELLLYNTKD